MCIRDSSETLITDANRDNDLIEMLINIRNNSRNKKDFTTSDEIRNGLSKLGIILEDTQSGTTWKNDVNHTSD